MGAVETVEVFRRHRVTVVDYYRMAEMGMLAPDARVELIDGEIVDMAPMKSLHASVVGALNALLSAAVQGRALVWCQLPLRLDDRSEPEPDLMLLRPRADFYRDAHPRAEDVCLLIEVSDTSARYDREIKVPLYARHGVAEVWIVDLDHRRLRVLREPHDGDYTEVVETASPGVVEPKALPGVKVDLASIFG